MSLQLQWRMALWFPQHSSCHHQDNQSKMMQRLPFLNHHRRWQDHDHSLLTLRLSLVTCRYGIAQILCLLCLCVETQVVTRLWQKSYQFLSSLHRWKLSWCTTPPLLPRQCLSLNPLFHRAVLRVNQVPCTMGWVQIHHHLRPALYWT